MGLDLFQQAKLGVEAIGAATDRQPFELTDQRQLGHVIRAAPGNHGGVSGHAFLHSGRGGEAQVEVTFLGGELAQLAHGDTQAQSLHST